MSNPVDIQIKKVNETFMQVFCRERFMEMDINDRFSFKIKNYKNDPRVKKGHWDGIIKLYNRKTKKMYCGLLFSLLKFLDSKNLSYSIDPSLTPGEDTVTLEDLKTLCEEVIQPVNEKGELLVPYDDQYKALEYMLNMDRTVCLAATSAGKSLIIYLATRIYQLTEELQNKKILIIVPTISLVEQIFSDFAIYSAKSPWSVHANCQKISSKYTKSFDKQIIITTWQSAAKFDYEFFDDVGAVFVDETHTAQAKELSLILERCSNTKYRHGLTGTLDDFECNELIIQGLLGHAKKIVTAKELIDKKRATKVIVRMVVIKHNPQTVKTFYETLGETKGATRYNLELDFLNTLQSRLKLLKGMIQAVPGNNVVLFDRVEKFGLVLLDKLKEDNPDTVFQFTGSVDSDAREEIRLNMESYDNAVIGASFQTFQLGVSIKKLHNAFLVSSSKSKIRVLQSLGRLMRMHDSKEVSYIYDIVDELSDGKRNNQTFAHAFERIKFYKNEGHPIEFISLAL